MVPFIADPSMVGLGMFPMVGLVGECCPGIRGDVGEVGLTDKARSGAWLDGNEVVLVL